MCSPSAGTAPITGSTPSMRTGGRSAAIGPAGESMSRQRFARGELRMLEELGDGVHARVRDLRGLEAGDELGRRESAPIAGVDRRVQRGAMLHAQRVRCGSARRRPARDAASTSAQKRVHSRTFWIAR